MIAPTATKMYAEAQQTADVVARQFAANAEHHRRAWSRA